MLNLIVCLHTNCKEKEYYNSMQAYYYNFYKKSDINSKGMACGCG